VKRRDSRRLIVAAARAEFSAHGYAGARVDTIARRAGVNKQLLFYYFGSKQGLYQSIIQGVAGEATHPSETASPASHAAARLRQEFTGLFDLLSSRREVARLLLLDSQYVNTGLSRQALNELLVRIRDVIAEGQGHGYFRDDVDPGRTARQALVLAVGYFALEPIIAGAPDPGRIADWRDGALDLLVRSLTW